MKNYAKGFLMVSVLALGWACTEDQDETFDEPKSSASLSATVEGENTNPPELNERIIVNGFSTTDFKVGIKEVEMRYAAKADLLAGIGLGGITLNTAVNASLQSNASKEQTLILMNGGSVQSETIAEGQTPEGSYQEIDLRLYKNTETEESETMHNKSLWIFGQIDGEDSQIWLDQELLISASAEEEDGVMVDGETAMELVFDLNKLFEGVDFSTAVDSNADGMIEIGPGSADDNATILTQIESNVSSAVTFRKK
ncbi:hypothetical protein [Arthrospiribacter ruber]|nr:hypothetical protein [Arthrospiribacter ruber]